MVLRIHIPIDWGNFLLPSYCATDTRRTNVRTLRGDKIDPDSESVIVPPSRERYTEDSRQCHFYSFVDG